MRINPATLRTERLTLRPPIADDAPRVADICNHKDVYANTLTLPYPYTEDDARAWIKRSADGYETGACVMLTIVETESNTIVGTAGLVIEETARRAEIGYIIGHAHRGKGFATEATRALIAHGFNALDLMRISGGRYPHNPASGRVLENAGMTFEGLLRNFEQKDGKSLDVHLYAITREDFDASSA